MGGIVYSFTAMLPCWFGIRTVQSVLSNVNTPWLIIDLVYNNHGVGRVGEVEYWGLSALWQIYLRCMFVKFQTSLPTLPQSPGKLLLVMSSIKTLQELHPFFTALSIYTPSITMSDCGQSKAVSLSELEAVIERDFLEKLPAR